MEITGSAFNSGLNAIQAGQRRVDQAAVDIAGNAVAPQPPEQASQSQQVNQSQALEQNSQADLAQSLVALTIGKTEAQAGAKVVETADEVLGTLIDTRA
ncbi:pyrroloquinoline quinone biosynthesis protein PqqE [Aquipseudomonas ullengensis]|uniref:Pyrroloquinoline quinone biosynthesis protein PqqE n=1 Tax=Aquipseudomonas ullengensis TaxID=2759166 RepID=A0A7W4LIJ5_9GAMM|nr:pyrroloquinoline quinone biosynthesis protein PqqE [Pseudomonas ullengensis]MBB2493840.1 pyrroloquinoline quinone biosynthesis protein PqqE [Pseudomonas ullengensis]